MNTTPDGMCLDEYSSNESLADVFFKRAIGELPEMESSKALAAMAAGYVKPDDRLLDVGCGAGHYLRSLRRKIQAPFSYVGVDPYPLFVNKAETAWRDDAGASFRLGSIFSLPVADREFDVVLCSNLLMHLPSIVTPVRQLVRAAKRQVIIRTLIGERSFRIQEVMSRPFWPYTEVRVEDEFDDEGQPRAFAFENIYSQGYFTQVIRRAAPAARVTYVEDRDFDPRQIQRSADDEGLVNATRVIDGKQVFGYILLPYSFVIIDLA